MAVVGEEVVFGMVAVPAYAVARRDNMPIPQFDYPYLFPKEELDLSDDILRLLKPIDKYYSELFLAIVELFNSPRGGRLCMFPIKLVEEGVFEEWVLSMYVDAIGSLWRRQWNSSLQEAQPELRECRKGFTAELEWREEISKQLAIRTPRPGSTIEQLFPGITSYEEVQILQKKTGVLKDIEEQAAALIDPTLRDDYEVGLANTSRYEAIFKQHRYSRRSNAADWRCDVIGIVEKELLALVKVLNLRAVSSRIDNFLAAFFDAAFNHESITAENVKTLRTRMRNQPRGFSALDC